MKKITALLLCFLLLCTCALTVFAEKPEGRDGDVLISVEVPDTHKVTVCAEGAAAFWQGVRGEEFTVERLSTPRILIRPESGKMIQTVLLNGVDVTALLHGGYLELSPVCEDQTITVITEDEPIPPPDTFTVKGKVTLNGQPLQNVVLELRSSLVATKTDKNGNFAFHGVALGEHSLTALKDGIVVGYLSFDMKKDAQTNLSLLENGSYIVSVDQTGAGVELHLVLNEELGIIAPTEIDTIEKTDPNGPPTGDNTRPLFWLILLLISAVCIAVSETRRRRKMQ